MSKEVMIDEKYLKYVFESTKNLIEFLSEESEIMINKDKDIFNRYMSHAKIRAVISASNFILNQYKDYMQMRNNLIHPFFQTDELKKYEWDKIKLENDEFFCTKA